MGKKEGFDVLRLIEHGNICYISSEYLPGKQLIYWLKEGKTLKKDNLYQWVRDMVKQLMRIYRCQGSQGYGYINPYCVLISEDCSLYYLDMETKSNEEVLEQIRQDPVIRHYFVPAGAIDCRQKDLTEELYGMGKTLQYILSVAYIRPELSKREARKLRKFISRCIDQAGKKEIQDISQLLAYLPESSQTTDNTAVKTMKLSVKVGIVVAVLLVATGARAWAFKEEPSSENYKEVSKEKEKIEKQDSGDNSDAVISKQEEDAIEKQVLLEQAEVAVMKLALNYFLELENPSKALEVLEENTEAINADEMKALACVIQACDNPDENLSSEEDFQIVAQSLEIIERNKETLELEDRVWCLVRGYGTLTEKRKTWEKEKEKQEEEEKQDEGEKDKGEENKESEAYESAEEYPSSAEYADLVISIGEAYLEDMGIVFPTEKTVGVNVNFLEDDTKEEGMQKNIKEIKQTIAQAYEVKGNVEVAIKEWQSLLSETKGWGEREEIYIKMEAIYEADGQVDQAITTCVQGLESCYESWTLRKLHIRLLCSDKGIDRGICAETIKTYLGQYPELQDDEEFKELQDQYGIKIEGEKVTVE